MAVASCAAADLDLWGKGSGQRHSCVNDAKGRIAVRRLFVILAAIAVFAFLAGYLTFAGGNMGH